MATVTITIQNTYSLSADSGFADAIYRFLGDDGGGMSRYAVEPNAVQYYTVRFNVDELPTNVVIMAAHLNFSVSSNRSVLTSNSVSVPDASTSGSTDEKIMALLSQNPRPDSLRFVFAHFYRSGHIEDKVEIGDVGWRDGQQAYESSMTKISVSLSVTYEEAEDQATVSYGISNAYQKCNVYFGTGGAWRKCKALYGINGSWKECK